MNEEVEEKGSIPPLTEVGPLGDDKKLARERKKEKVQADLDDAAVLTVMSSSSGRRFVANVLRSCEYGHVAMMDSSRMTAFVLGQQNVAHILIGELRRLCIDKVRLMEDEERE